MLRFNLDPQVSEAFTGVETMAPVRQATLNSQSSMEKTFADGFSALRDLANTMPSAASYGTAVVGRQGATVELNASAAPIVVPKEMVAEITRENTKTGRLKSSGPAPRM